MISRRRLLRAGVAAPAIIKLWPALMREAQAAATFGGIIPQGVWPEVSALPQILNQAGIANTTQMPNLFVLNSGSGLNNGSAITTKDQWYQRRSQLKAMFQYYLYGRMPPPSPVTVVQTYTATTNTTPPMTQKTVYCRTGPGGALPFIINMYFPTSTNSPYGSGPFPVILTGEAGWSPVFLGPSTSYSASPGAAVLAQLVNTNGYIIAEFNRDNFSPDEGDLSNDDLIFTTPPVFIESPLTSVVAGGPPSGMTAASKALYQMYPFDRSSGPALTIPGVTAGTITPPGAGAGGWTGYDWGLHTAWSWGAMRVIDYFFNNASSLNLDTRRIATTGISRGTTSAWPVAALDERVAVTLPQQTVAFFSARQIETDGPLVWYNVFNEQTGVQDGPVENNGQLHPQYTPRMASFWQVDGTAQTVKPYGGRGKCATVIPNIGKFPFDAHSLAALIAPRYLMNVESLVWEEQECCGSAQVLRAAQQAWTALGFSNRVWNVYTDIDVYNGGHEMWGPMWTWNVQFCEYAFRGVALPASSTTAGSQEIWCNATTPTATNGNGVTGLSRGFPTYAPIYGGLGADGNTGFAWSTPTLT